MRIAIITSRATSLMNVARDVAYVIKKQGYSPLLLDYMVPASSLRMICDAVIIVMTMNPLIARPWILLSRDARLYDLPSFVYTTVEGRLPMRYIKPWMIREVEFVANSNYTRAMLEQSGLNVIDMVYHGVNFQEIEDALKFKKQARKFIEEKLGKGVYFGSVVSGHPRKGLREYANVVRQVVEKNKDAKFYILTTNEALPLFAGIKNVVIDKMFGKRQRIEVLALISAFDYYVHPSLAEGFGLPVLEAMALGVPTIHIAYEPLTEFSSREFSFQVPYTRVEYVSFGEGIEYELHLYDTNAFAETILVALDTYKNKQEIYNDMRAKALKQAKNYDIMKLYPKLLQHLGLK
ncbi:MAG: hypothetical protein DRP01_03225 [Archaeoglobales archaeon]|nr:MAG: hypothetical protein DRP01_03225 [Archaeoglobales archaeon]